MSENSSKPATRFCRVRTCDYPATLRLTVCVRSTSHRGEIGEAPYVTEEREDWFVCSHHRKIAGSRIRGSHVIHPIGLAYGHGGPDPIARLRGDEGARS